MEEFLAAFDDWLASDENCYGEKFEEMLAARARLTSLPPDACGGVGVDDESNLAAGAGEANR